MLKIEPLDDPAALLVSTLCAVDVTATVFEAETEIVVTLAGDRVDDDCAGSVVVTLDAAPGARFIRDGANGTVFGWDGTEYIQVAPPPDE